MVCSKKFAGTQGYPQALPGPHSATELTERRRISKISNILNNDCTIPPSLSCQCFFESFIISIWWLVFISNHHTSRRYTSGGQWTAEPVRTGQYWCAMGWCYFWQWHRVTTVLGDLRFRREWRASRHIWWIFVKRWVCHWKGICILGVWKFNWTWKYGEKSTETSTVQTICVVVSMDR